MKANEPLRTDERIGNTIQARTATVIEFVLSQIASGAAERDAHPTFPEGPFRALAAAGILAMPAPEPGTGSRRRASFAEEWRVLRAVARADGSVGRILDGHLNGVERVSVLAPEPLRSRDLAAVAAGRLRLGVWGADPIPGEGTPARLVETESGYALEGVKTFCSGATGIDRALVADSAVEGALDILAAKSQGRPPDDLASLAAGRTLASRGTIDRWLEHAASFVDTNPEASTAHFSTQLRESIAAAARDILDVAARAVGSHPFAIASDLDRARRDLELFLLQHRLEPALARIGRRAIEQREARA